MSDLLFDQSVIRINASLSYFVGVWSSTKLTLWFIPDKSIIAIKFCGSWVIKSNDTKENILIVEEEEECKFGMNVSMINYILHTFD